MPSHYPYDPTVRRAVARALYGLLPALYRARDLAPVDAVPEGQRAFLADLHALADGAPPPPEQQLPRGAADLYNLLHVLAAPLAVLRESVHDLHADLFIDTCADEMLPLLAGQIGARLVFKSPDDDRVDLRNTIQWRRRKGTPAMLQEMVQALLDRPVTFQESWPRLLVSQAINTLRPERRVPAVRSASLAVTHRGPYDRELHALDARRRDARLGGYHPRHLSWWAHPTRLFPVREATPAMWPAHFSTPDADRRYLFHHAGAEVALRVDPSAPDVDAPTDRVPLALFAESPGRFFDDTGRAEGKFTVRSLGLPAAVASSARADRGADIHPAGPTLYNRAVTLSLLQRGGGVQRGEVEVTVCRVPLGGADGAVPDLASAVAIGGLSISATGTTAVTATDPPALTGDAITAIRVTRSPSGSCWFPGATIELVGTGPDARRSSEHATIAAQGYLRAALVVEVPATWVWGTRWLYLAADGSLYDAQPDNEPATGAALAAGVAMVPGDGGWTLPGAALTTSAGPSWPPAALRAGRDPLRNVPPPLGRPPAIVHGASAIPPTTLGEAEWARLTFALALETTPGAYTFHPILHLQWNALEPPTTALAWVPLSGSGSGAALSDRATTLTRWRSLAQLAADAPRATLVLRLESSVVDLVLPPCEVAFSDADGEAALLHLPELRAVAPAGQWASASPAASAPVAAMRDGSTWHLATDAPARYATGAAVPLREAALLRRRVVRGRKLCPWRAETEGARLAPTPSGSLDVDPEHGLFALSMADALPVYPGSLVGWSGSANVTVDWQEGASDHLGAKAAARASEVSVPTDLPTHVVSAMGRISPRDPPARRALPIFPRVSDAVAGITPAPSPGADVRIEVEGCATYAEPDLSWPTFGVRSVELYGAERARPVLRVLSHFAGMSHFESLTLRGLVIDCDGGFVLPTARRTEVQLCTMYRPGSVLHSVLSTDAAGSDVHVYRCDLVRVEVVYAGRLHVERSVVHSADQEAVSAGMAAVRIDRSTIVRGSEDRTLPCVRAATLDASETILSHHVAVQDRFAGGVRYGRVEPGSRTPKRYRVTEVPLRFVALDRFDPAHLRLSERADAGLLRGAEDGWEVGAFHDAGDARRAEGTLRRLMESVPAGSTAGVIHKD